MKIEAKGIQCMEGRDGYAFRANIYLDGKKVGSVHDGGYGGCLDIEIPVEHTTRIQKHISGLSKEEREYCRNNIETFLSYLVLETLDHKDWKRQMKAKVHFIDPTKDPIAVRVFKAKKTPHFLAHMQTKFPHYIFLDDMTEEEAFKKMKVHADKELGLV